LLWSYSAFFLFFLLELLLLLEEGFYHWLPEHFAFSGDAHAAFNFAISGDAHTA
jgi:hypothetical protein